MKVVFNLHVNGILYFHVSCLVSSPQVVVVDTRIRITDADKRHITTTNMERDYHFDNYIYEWCDIVTIWNHKFLANICHKP